MPNLYATLNQIKSDSFFNLPASTSGYDTDLLRALGEGSRQFEKDTGRFFYIYEGTFYQDGAANRLILDWDVQTITTLKCDTDGDGSYESAYTVDMNNPTTSPDAFAYPANTLPKTRLEANPWGSYGHFGAGIRKAVQIVGAFGYGNDWPTDFKHTAVVTIGADFASTATSISISGNSTSEISAGHTLRIGSEQLYVNAALSGSLNSTCPVTRAVNGTSAAAATSGSALSIYDYPAPVIKAVLIYAMRTWKRRESAFQNTVISTDMGGVTVWKGDDPDYLKAVKLYGKVLRMSFI